VIKSDTFLMLPSRQPITWPGYASHGSAFRPSEPSRHTIQRPWFLWGNPNPSPPHYLPIQTLARRIPPLSSRCDLPSLPPSIRCTAAPTWSGARLLPLDPGARLIPSLQVHAPPSLRRLLVARFDFCCMFSCVFLVARFDFLWTDLVD
jgi:hypothetical protein